MHTTEIIWQTSGGFRFDTNKETIIAIGVFRFCFVLFCFEMVFLGGWEDMAWHELRCGAIRYGWLRTIYEVVIRCDGEP